MPAKASPWSRNRPSAVLIVASYSIRANASWRVKTVPKKSKSEQVATTDVCNVFVPVTVAGPVGAVGESIVKFAVHVTTFPTASPGKPDTSSDVTVPVSVNVPG
jgi:hypothetical protein